MVLSILIFRLLRKLILLTAVNSDMAEARDRAVALYKAYRDEETPVAPNLRWIAYSAGVKFGDKEDWKFAWEKYSNSQVRTILWTPRCTMALEHINISLRNYLW